MSDINKVQEITSAFVTEMGVLEIANLGLIRLKLVNNSTGKGYVFWIPRIIFDNNCNYRTMRTFEIIDRSVVYAEMKKEEQQKSQMIT